MPDPVQTRLPAQSHLVETPPPVDVRPRRALGQTAWSTASFGLAQVIRLGSNLILTRYLVPDDYGVMAVANAVIIGLALFSDLGTTPFLIQHPFGTDKRYFNTAWTTNVVRGLLLWVCSIGLAIPLASWYNAHVLIWVIPALGFGAFINGFTSTSLQLLTRQIALPRVLSLNLFATLVGTTVTITWVVFVRASVWGFVVGHLTSSAVTTLGSHALLPGHRNRLCWDRVAGAEMFRLGKWVFVSTVFTFLGEQADRLVLGKYAGLRELGYYHLASQLCAAPLQLLAAIGSSILFPILSESVRRGREQSGQIHRIRKRFQTAGTGLLLVPLIGGPFVVRVLFGDRYIQAGWMTQVLAAGAFIKMFGLVGDNLFRALGKPERLAVVNIGKAVALVIFLPIGAAIGGLSGLLFGLIAADLARYLVSAYVLSKEGFGVLREDAIFFLAFGAAALGVIAG